MESFPKSSLTQVISCLLLNIFLRFQALSAPWTGENKDTPFPKFIGFIYYL